MLLLTKDDFLFDKSNSILNIKAKNRFQILVILMKLSISGNPMKPGKECIFAKNTLR